MSIVVSLQETSLTKFLPDHNPTSRDAAAKHQSRGGEEKMTQKCMGARVSTLRFILFIAARRSYSLSKKAAGAVLIF